MTADVAYRTMQYAINKNQGGYLSPSDFNLVIHQASLSYLDFLLGEFQTYQVGRPVSKVQYSMNENVRNSLTALIDVPTTLTIDNTGLAPYPDDYQQTDAMWDASMNRIRFVPQHKLYSYLSSQIDPVSTNPIYLLESDGFRFYPNITYNNVALSTAKLSYVHTPRQITWGYTLDANGLPVYNPATSIDPEWYDADMLDVIARALALVGVNLESPQIEQYANMIKQAGQ
jgi:hypothetical protein